jgi:hypothetical protein
MRRAFFVMLVCAPLVTADDKSEPKDPKAPKAREITFSGEKVRLEGQWEKPTKVTTEKELAKVVADKDERAAVLKKVNLKKEYLLVFAWGGSGGDRVGLEVSKDGKTVTFKKTPGLTLDLVMHVKLYAVPAGAKYKVSQ